MGCVWGIVWGGFGIVGGAFGCHVGERSDNYRLVPFGESFGARSGDVWGRLGGRLGVVWAAFGMLRWIAPAIEMLHVCGRLTCFEHIVLLNKT